MPNWQTLWSIAGPQLFDSPTTLINNTVIKPIDEATSLEMIALRVRGMQLTATSENYVVHYPPSDEIKSKHLMQIDVFGEDYDEALDNSKKIAFKLATCLSLVADGARYYIEFKKMRRINDVQEFNGWSETATLSPLKQPIEMSRINASTAAKIFDLIDNDPIANNAYVNLITAWQLLDTAGSKPLQSSVLQHFILSIEAIVNGMMANIRKTKFDKIRLNERNYASEFAKDFILRPDKPEAIREAAKQLSKISLNNFTDKIDMVAPVLNIETEMSDLSKEFYRFRSSQLSHPGSKDISKFNFWLQKGSNTTDLCKADHIARHFFMKYCNHISA